MQIQEIIAVIFSLLCVVLTIRRNVWCWPTGIIGILAYILVFYDTKLYADLILQLFFLGQSVYGWLLWANTYETESNKIVKVRKIEKMDLVFHLPFALFVWVAFSCIMILYTDNSIPTIDSFLAVMSFVANYYLAKRYLENWIIWMIVDIIYVGVFIYKELYLSAGLYVVFFVMAIYGYVKWKKLFKKTIKVPYRAIKK